MSEERIIQTVVNIPAGFPNGYECFFILVNRPYSSIRLNIEVGQLPSRQDLDVLCFIVTREDFERWSTWVDSDRTRVRRPDIRTLFHRRSSLIQDVYEFKEAGEYAIVIANTHSVMTPKRVWITISRE